VDSWHIVVVWSAVEWNGMSRERATRCLVTIRGTFDDTL
jgi:hypothetical protein